MIISLEYNSDTGLFSYRGFDISLDNGIGHESDYSYVYTDYVVSGDGRKDEYYSTMGDAVEAIDSILDGDVL